MICGTYQEGEEETEEAYIYGKAVDFIKSNKDGGPFCTFISTYAPHDSYTVPQDIYHMYDDTDIPLPESYQDDLLDKPAVYRRLKEVWKAFGAAEAKEIMRCYYSYCTLMWKRICKSGDHTMSDAQYVMLRFAPEGPRKRFLTNPSNFL